MTADPADLARALEHDAREARARALALADAVEAYVRAVREDPAYADVYADAVLRAVAEVRRG